MKAFAALSVLYPDTKDLLNANGKFKAFFGIGMLVGFVFGAVLYLGGYMVVFLVNGAIVIASAVMIRWVPDSVDQVSSSREESIMAEQGEINTDDKVPEKSDQKAFSINDAKP